MFVVLRNVLLDLLCDHPSVVCRVGLPYVTPINTKELNRYPDQFRPYREHNTNGVTSTVS